MSKPFADGKSTGDSRISSASLINFRFFGSLLFQKVFDINGEIIGEFMIHNLFSQ